MKIIEPLKQEEKLAQEIEKTKARKVLIVFWHGLGDLVMFLPVYNALREAFSKVHFCLAVQKGLGFEEIVPWARLIDADDLRQLDKFDCDLAAKIHFPVETDPALTKGELCCKLELGINPIAGHGRLPQCKSRLIGVHFQNTALPDVFNPSKDIAEKIWNEVLRSGFVPIELAFRHVFHNPKNDKFDFIDCTVRRAVPKISTLLGLMGACAGVICAVSGPLHCAISIMPERTLFLEKRVPINRFTRLSIASIDVNDEKYKDGKVEEWLQNLVT